MSTLLLRPVRDAVPLAVCEMRHAHTRIPSPLLARFRVSSGATEPRRAVVRAAGSAAAVPGGGCETRPAEGAPSRPRALPGGSTAPCLCRRASPAPPWRAARGGTRGGGVARAPEARTPPGHRRRGCWGGESQPPLATALTLPGEKQGMAGRQVAWLYRNCPYISHREGHPSKDHGLTARIDELTCCRNHGLPSPLPSHLAVLIVLAGSGDPFSHAVFARARRTSPILLLDFEVMSV